MADSSATALYIFPTKALAQDQQRGLVRFVELEPDLPIRSGTYDGDTPDSTRRKLRENANVILTNPTCCIKAFFRPIQVGVGSLRACDMWS